MTQEEICKILEVRKIFPGENKGWTKTISKLVMPTTIKSGDYLFHQGDEGDAMYFVVSGRLTAWVRDPADRDICVGEIPPGEPVGEMALLTGEPRSASIRASRQSILLRLSKDAFEELTMRYPALGLAICRQIVTRYQCAGSGKKAQAQSHRIAVYAATRDSDLEEFCAEFGRAMQEVGKAEVMFAPEGDRQQREYVERLEQAEHDHDYLILCCNPSFDAWSRFCLSQADRIVVVATGVTRIDLTQSRVSDVADRPTSLERYFAARDLVFLHSSRQVKIDTQTWCESYKTESCHHVMLSDPDSMRRVARLLTGNAIGAVFSGGAARGFAHVGLMKALEAHGIVIDHVGGTSMGGIMASQYATGISAEELSDWSRELWPGVKRKNDYTLPLYSIVVGRKYGLIATLAFGDLDMADLWLPCFVVSANITQGCAVVHRRGPLRHLARATGALPGILPPVHMGGDIHVDGSILNNLPVDVMKGMNRGLVIASNIGAEREFAGSLHPDEFVSGWSLAARRLIPWAKKKNLPSIGELTLRSSMLASEVNSDRMCAMADLVMPFDITHVGLLDWDRCAEIIDDGYEQAMPVVENWCERNPGLRSSS